MNLSKKSQKIYERLISKTEFLSKTRMPAVKCISHLLSELGIEHHTGETDCQKWSSAAGCRYYTSGGSRWYDGYTLKVPSINLNIDTTETYYSWNTGIYANELVRLVKKTLNI